ncbi:MAG: acyl carrier protein [Lachnospiraceae bacterium]|nr:acyl carrier protein [Lachnospiraceae bacterium]
MTFDKVKEIIVDTLGCDEEAVVLTATLKDDLGADSLDAVELNMALEEEFGLSIPDEALVKFVTVKDIVEYIDANA